MTPRLAVGVGIVVAFVALTVVMTWPQAAHMGTHVANNDDPLLSIWRISWIAHALPRYPAQFFNGNIFYPEPRTLAYSDAVLLQGLVAAPFIWSGISQVTAYNWLLLGSIASSGATMWLYAVELTGSRTAAILAGIVFAFAPFRFDHFHHLELQATAFIPLTLWWLERAFARGRATDVYGAIASLSCQALSGIYYAVFLASALLLIVPLRLWMLPADRRRSLLGSFARSIAVAALVLGPYLLIYSLNRGALGDRSVTDVELYSATLPNYFSMSPDSILHGIWSGPLGENERHLSPGLVALLLASVGLYPLDRRRVTLVLLGLVGLVISLGLNTPVYGWLLAIGAPYSGLRVPARAAILVCAAVAALTAVGWGRIESRLKRRVIATVLIAMVLLADSATRFESWLVLSKQPVAVYRWLAEQPRSVVVEFPVSTADRLNEIPDGLYMLGSTIHWQPILNGYSGYYPQSYFQLLKSYATFPDEMSIAYLKSRGVDFIVVHGGNMSPDRLGAITTGLLARSDVQPVARFEEHFGPDVVFRLHRDGPGGK